MMSVSEKTARQLLDIEAVKLNIKDPFTWASGLKSPVYCDNRKILSFPAVRDSIADALAQIVKENFDDAEVIAGVATGAIAHGVLVAEKLKLPFIYVRSSQKGHGLGNQIEGVLPENKKVVVVEDLISTGQSSLAAVDALIESGANVLGMAAIFTYNLEQALSNMQSAKCRLFTLTDYDTLIRQAVNMGVMHHSNMQSLEDWRKNPSQWK